MSAAWILPEVEDVRAVWLNQSAKTEAAPAA